MRMIDVEASSRSFLEFARAAEPRLRYALVAALGVERGLEATNNALVYGWEHWERVGGMDNPIGYLYRVGQRKGRRRRMISSKACGGTIPSSCRCWACVRCWPFPIRR